VLAAIVTLAGCTAPGQDATAGESPGKPPGVQSVPPGDPFPDCAGVAVGPVSPDLPDLTLPCFHRGTSVRLSQLTGPAVINIWASWCDPCREELPAFVKLAERTAGKLTVLGVDTKDTRGAAISVAEDLGLTYPSLVDEEGKLGVQLVVLRKATAGIPITLFVKDGKIAYTYQGKALDRATLDRLVTTHLGVSL
jgi:thiol-disulfide isomerase/thioredoxin